LGLGRYERRQCPPSFAKSAKEGWGNRSFLSGKDGPAPVGLRPAPDPSARW